MHLVLAISLSLASSFETRHDGHLLGPIARIINNLRTMQMPIFRSVVNLLPLFINAHRPPFAFHLGRWCKQVRNNYSTRSTIGGGRAYVPQGTMEMLWNLYCYWFGFSVFRWLPSSKNMIENVNILVFFLLKTTSSFLFSLVTWQWWIKAWCFRKNISADFLLVSYLSTLLRLLVYIIKRLLQIRNRNGRNAQEHSGDICWSWTSTCFHCPSWVPPSSITSTSKKCEKSKKANKRGWHAMVFKDLK